MGNAYPLLGTCRSTGVWDGFNREQRRVRGRRGTEGSTETVRLAEGRRSTTRNVKTKGPYEKGPTVLRKEGQ